MRTTGGWLLIVLLLLSCQREGPEGPKTFFDLKGFFDAELLRIGGQHDVIKTVQIDGQAETQTLGAYAWTSEISLLQQWDINRPAWRDQYQRDTLVRGPQIQLHYQSLDDDLQVRSLNVWQTGEVVDSILIETAVKNPLRSTNGTYRYVPSVGLDFQQISSRRFGSKQDLSVSVQLKSPSD